MINGLTTNLSTNPDTHYREDLQLCTIPDSESISTAPASYQPVSSESNPIKSAPKFTLAPTLLTTIPESTRVTSMQSGASGGIGIMIMLAVGAALLIYNQVEKMHTEYRTIIANDRDEPKETPGSYIYPPLTVRNFIECYCSFNHGTRLTRCNMDRCEKKLGERLNELERNHYKCEAKLESYDYKFKFPPKEKHAPISTRFKRYVVNCKR
jgi:hypothetical protein